AGGEDDIDGEFEQGRMPDAPQEAEAAGRATKDYKGKGGDDENRRGGRDINSKKVDLAEAHPRPRCSKNSGNVCNSSEMARAAARSRRTILASGSACVNSRSSAARPASAAGMRPSASGRKAASIAASDAKRGATHRSRMIRAPTASADAI